MKNRNLKLLATFIMCVGLALVLSACNAETVLKFSSKGIKVVGAVYKNVHGAVTDIMASETTSTEEKAQVRDVMKPALATTYSALQVATSAYKTAYAAWEDDQDVNTDDLWTAAKALMGEVVSLIAAYNTLADTYGFDGYTVSDELQEILDYFGEDTDNSSSSSS